MDIKSYHKGHAEKTVVVENVTDADTMHDIKCFALAAAGETWSSVFGMHTNEPPFSPGVVIVDIYTD